MTNPFNPQEYVAEQIEKHYRHGTALHDYIAMPHKDFRAALLEGMEKARHAEQRKVLVNPDLAFIQKVEADLRAEIRREIEGLKDWDEATNYVIQSVLDLPSLAPPPARGKECPYSDCWKVHYHECPIHGERCNICGELRKDARGREHTCEGKQPNNTNP
jgi:hypothetical protein